MIHWLIYLIYRVAVRTILFCLRPFQILPPFGRVLSRSTALPSATGGQSRRIWFHAASAGELQGLWPVIVDSADQHYQIILTIFSPSAERGLFKLIEDLEERNRKSIIWAGFSPAEGTWSSALSAHKPDLFVTLKYEAWPDLWASLVTVKIPLAIVNARPRTSLKWGARICRLLTGKIPEIIPLAVDDEDAKKLKRLFPSSDVTVTGDPRWDQMRRRAERKSPRAEMLIRTFQRKEHPWGVLGSLWKSDLDFLTERVFHLPGTIWVVPHHVEGFHLDEILLWLRKNLISFESTKNRFFSLGSSPEKPGAKVIVVDEMGILAELYSKADWAYVGGGYEGGVHSTLEPAFYGIPIGIGPKNYRLFPEIHDLRRTRQVTLLNSPQDRNQWMANIGRNQFEIDRKIWEAQAKARLGATDRVLKVFPGILGG